MADPSIQAKNLGPAFVAVGYYDEPDTWFGVGNPEMYEPGSFGGSADITTLDDAVNCLDGLLVSTSISMEGNDPAIAQSASGVNYGGVVHWATNATITLETTVATARSIYTLSTGVRQGTFGTTDVPAPTIQVFDALFNAASTATTQNNTRHLGVGIKPLNSIANYEDIVADGDNETADPTDYWFGSVYPSQRTVIELNNASGENAQNNFTFELKTRLRCAEVLSQYVGPGQDYNIGGQMPKSFAELAYGAIPTWASLIPLIMRNA